MFGIGFGEFHVRQQLAKTATDILNPSDFLECAFALQAISPRCSCV